jgi:hypothetical protein
MRGADIFTEKLRILRMLDFIPIDHSFRSIRRLADVALAKIDRLIAGCTRPIPRVGVPALSRESCCSRRFCRCSAVFARSSR